jgi:hypothetical protein
MTQTIHVEANWTFSKSSFKLFLALTPLDIYAGFPANTSLDWFFALL